MIRYSNPRELIPRNGGPRQPPQGTQTAADNGSPVAERRAAGLGPCVAGRLSRRKRRPPERPQSPREILHLPSGRLPGRAKTPSVVICGWNCSPSAWSCSSATRSADWRLLSGYKTGTDLWWTWSAQGVMSWPCKHRLFERSLLLFPSLHEMRAVCVRWSPVG